MMVMMMTMMMMMMMIDKNKNDERKGRLATQATRKTATRLTINMYGMGKETTADDKTDKLRSTSLSGNDDNDDKALEAVR